MLDRQLFEKSLVFFSISEFLIKPIQLIW